MVTLTPTEMPTRRLIIRLMTQVVLPTAARLAWPAQRPTTTTSAVLKSSWRRLAAIRGRLNSRILPSRGPWVMSMAPPEKGLLDLKEFMACVFSPI